MYQVLFKKRALFLVMVPRGSHRSTEVFQMIEIPPLGGGFPLQV